ncbi:hypothetical protein CTEN210_09452 [Chaetoceros tenuissimus]|uniref:procollagen-lysine 5-dioxygenase n=1 Tax=Chaetoceros tenuissimus TaxID=426638 RepID=A0AAD3CVG2_9STRA|nr:hypothetical protein CTEN210_09452 [Chaetoceros tenuissimus]
MSEQQQDIPSLISSFLGNTTKKKELDTEAKVVMPSRDDLKLRTTNGNDIETTSSQIIKGWTPSTTNSLLTPPNVIGACDIIDHTFGKAFAKSLQTELEMNNIHEKLEPARTAQDLQTNDLMQSFSAFTGTTSNVRSSVRQDLSSIVPRSFRKSPTFRTKYPHLHKMISSIEQTVSLYLVDKKQNSFGNVDINLDLSLTSVQIAKYKGDGISGYKRHCDNGLTCNHDVSSTSTEGANHRVITAVYYLTDEDWNDDDAGHLRIYDLDKSCSNDSQKYYDILPYSDRLVLFRSDLVEHEVLPSMKRTRMAITVWLYGTVNQHSKQETKLQEMVKNEKGYKEYLCSSIPPLQTLEDSNYGDKKIFVSIPAYRDTETHPTIRSLIENATYPDRVFVGVVYQYDTYSELERKKYEDGKRALPQSWTLNNLRTLTLDYRNATGPCYARYLAQSLLVDEEYILQIDSHMRFRTGWDEFLIQQLHQCPNPERSVLTKYPPGYTLPNEISSETRATLLVPWKFDSHGMLRQKGRLLNESETLQNIPCLLYAAGFNFSCASVIKDCPYDKHLPHLFFGEELSMAIRLYMHGYDLYSPPTTVCYHLWSRDHRTTFQGDFGTTNDNEKKVLDKKRLASLEKVKCIMRGDGDQLGSVRSVDEFWKSLNVDRDKKVLYKGAEDAGLSPDSFASHSSALLESIANSIKNM